MHICIKLKKCFEALGLPNLDFNNTSSTSALEHASNAMKCNTEEHNEVFF
jgi:hypothetical protein